MSTQNSAIQSVVQQVEANFTAVKQNLTTIATGVQALDAKIVALQQQLSTSGTLSADDQAALNQVVTDSATLVQQSQSIDTSVPATPPSA